MRILHPSLVASVAVLLGLAAAGVSGPAVAQSAAGGQLKAAIVYNIIRFVDFAPGGDATLSLCVSRSAAAPRELGSLNGQRVGARIITLRMIDPASTGDCDVVYLGHSVGDLPRVRQPGVLVIGDGTDFVGAGGTVGLVQTGGQVRFEVNVRAARASRLEISSKLLRLAARVQQ